MTDLIFIEAVLPRDATKLFSYCDWCRRSHYLSECTYRIGRAKKLKAEVAALRQQLADVSGEIA